jgi:hypothetical protein
MSENWELDGDRELDGEVPGFVSCIMAVADPEASWWERARGNPKRMGELSQGAFFGSGTGVGIWAGCALGR